MYVVPKMHKCLGSGKTVYNIILAGKRRVSKGRVWCRGFSEGGLSAPFAAEGEDENDHHEHADEGFDRARDHWIGYYRGCSFS